MLALYQQLLYEGRFNSHKQNRLPIVSSTGGDWRLPGVIGSQIKVFDGH
ncbi:hypothetical protein [Anoxynatronum sibiricum]